METIWPLIKLLISLEEFIAWSRTYLISHCQAADIDKLQAFQDRYKAASSGTERIAEARKIQEEMRSNIG